MAPPAIPSVMCDQNTLLHIILETMDSCLDAGYACSIRKLHRPRSVAVFTCAVCVGFFSRRIKLLFSKGLRYFTSSGVQSLPRNTSLRTLLVSRRNLILKDKRSLG